MGKFTKTSFNKFINRNGENTIIKIGFSGGVTLFHFDGNLYSSILEKTTSLNMETVLETLEPMFFTVINPSEFACEPQILLPSCKFSKMICDPTTTNIKFDDWVRANYSIGLMHYHFYNLFENYAKTLDGHEKRLKIPGYNVGNLTRTPVDGIYYEFDALMTAALRAYDLNRYLLWNEASNCPDNYGKTLIHCKSIDEKLKSDLLLRWENFGKKFKQYRNCLIHNNTFGVGNSLIIIQKLPIDLWSIWAQIPENPGINKREKFTYYEKLDALDYGWNVIEEVTNTIRELYDLRYKTEQIWKEH